MTKTIKKVKEELKETRKIQDPTKEKMYIITLEAQFFRFREYDKAKDVVKQLLDAGICHLELKTE